MNIKNKYAHGNSFWDWTPLNECFGGTNIRVTDIDGFVERNGKFLIIETKKPNEPVPQGQTITFDALVSTGLFTIVIIWGRHNLPLEIDVLTRNEKENRRYREASMTLLQTIVTNWFNYADGGSSLGLPKSDNYMKFFAWDRTSTIGRALGHEGDCQACNRQMERGMHFRIADGRIMHLECVTDWEARSRVINEARAQGGRMIA